MASSSSQLLSSLKYELAPERLISLSNRIISNLLKAKTIPHVSKAVPLCRSFGNTKEGHFCPSYWAKTTHFQKGRISTKIVLYVTQRNGPILGAETDLFVLQYSHGCSRGKVGVKLKYNFQSKNRLEMQTYVLCSPRGLIRLNMQSKKFLQPEFCSKISMIICAVFDDRHS